MDLLFVNGYPFLTTKSSKLNFLTGHPCKSRSTSQIKTVLDMVLNKYNDVESTESEKRKNSENEEPVSSHGRHVRENSGSGVERLEMSFDAELYRHNTYRQFMIIKENYN